MHFCSLFSCFSVGNLSIQWLAVYCNRATSLHPWIMIVLLSGAAPNLAFTVVGYWTALHFRFTANKQFVSLLGFWVPEAMSVTHVSAPS